MALSGPPFPPQNYAPLAQYWGSFLVGAWLYYGPPMNRYLWEGNGPVGYVGGPASYTYIPYPGTSVFPSPTPPAPKSPTTPQSPPPPAPGTGPKQEIPPPKPPITGDQDDPRQDGCGPPGAMAELAVESRLGWGGDQGLASPAVANLSSLPVHSQLAWSETTDPNKYVVYTREPKVVKDEQGRYQVVHTGKASGVVVFSPPQLFDHHSYGDGMLFDSRWPDKISESTLLLLNSPSATGGNDAISRLAFGTAYQTGVKPKLGWHFEYRPTFGQTLPETLSLYCTDDEAANVSVAADYATFDINADVRVRGKLTVDGIIDPTGLVLTEQASTPWASAAGYGAIYVKNTSPSTLVFVDDTGAETTLGAGGGTGDVVGPGSATDNALARFDSTTGKLIQDGEVILDDAGAGSVVMHSKNNGAGASKTLILDTGTASTTAGTVDVGTLTAEGVNIGRTGKTTTISGPAVGASSIKSTSATGGIGYATGAGGAVTQLTSKSTSVTLNTPCGRITMNNAALAAGASVTFYVDCSVFEETADAVIAMPGGAGKYSVQPSLSTGIDARFYLTVTNITTGSLSEALVINFAIIKGVTS